MVARRARLEGKEAVMLNASNCRFEPRFMEAFRQLAISQGARFFERPLIERGRIGLRVSADDKLIRADGRLSTPCSRWAWRCQRLQGSESKSCGLCR
jgi:hypothetical protein